MVKWPIQFHTAGPVTIGGISVAVLEELNEVYSVVGFVSRFLFKILGKIKICNLMPNASRQKDNVGFMRLVRDMGVCDAETMTFGSEPEFDISRCVF